MASVIRAIITPISLIDKDLGKLVLQVTAVVAAFIPGGQPFAVAAALALVVLYKPKGPKPEQQERSIKVSIPSRVSAYGKVRLFGAYILYVTNKDGHSVDAWAFHDGKANKIIHRYLGEKIVKTLSDGYVIGQGKEFGNENSVIQIGNTTGLPTETAFPEVIAKLPGEWTSAHRGDGVVTGFMTCNPVKNKYYNDVFPQGGPDGYPMSLVMEAQLVYDWRDPSQDPYDESTWKYSDNAALCTAHYLMKRANRDWNTNFLPAVERWTAAADDCDVAMPVIHFGTVVTVPTEGNLTLKNYAELMSVDGLSVGTQIKFHGIDKTATITGITDNTVRFTPFSPVDIPAKTYVTWTGTMTEPRYRVCLAHKHNESHKVVIGNLLACWDGFLTDRGDGVLIPWSGRYVDPDPADLIGPDEIVSYSWDFGVADEDQFNVISLSYISENHDYTVVDTDEWRDEASILEDGEEKKTGIENSVPSHSQARRLAKRLVSKNMSSNRGTITTNKGGRKVRGKRYIPLHIEEAGAVFFSGTAEIVRIRRNLATGGVTFDWIKADPNVDEWNPVTEEGFPAPVGDPIAPAPLNAIEIDTAIPEFVGDNTSAIINVEFQAPDRPDLTWFGRWRRSVDSVWNEQQYTDIDASSTVLLQIGPVPVNSIIDVAVAYSNGAGAVSDWSISETVDTSTALLAPNPVTEVESLGSVGQVTTSWRNPETPFQHVRIDRNTTNDLSTATQINGDILGANGATMVYDDLPLAAGTYYYWIRSVSSNGVLSVPVATGGVVVT